ncbi:threonine--tRNA ligase [Amycolatopsis jiangsuensis]|uniref:Threonine--tRNA ligase n=1 Tax=Amycolatopsis jiangsuensis TaxID=1181879 RepID=A0A840ILX9_9PSEU|nr:threonine--tRNA ligase [Amycolatopsis jiangsuensis]MBB4682933.1 threonyl-tRNA synthetase [Amycolatopsis jiangsuensis]
MTNEETTVCDHEMPDHDRPEHHVLDHDRPGDHDRPEHHVLDHDRPDHDLPDHHRFDHRRLGRELGLFGGDPLIGAGLPYLLPDGAAVRHVLEEYVRAAERRAGYRHVCSPVLGKRELYELSGHWEHYRDDMFPPMRAGGEELVLRPSLCPHHALIYRSRGRSHRELPVRLAELGGMYRAEPTGVLGGLSRVRAIQLNDGHVFCTPVQVAGEVRGALELIRRVHADLGVKPVRYRLSLPGEGGKYAGAPENWARSAELLAEALEGFDYERAPGEAAFYGPKIDVQVADSAGREWTLSTVQVDVHQPERFGLEYTGPDGRAHRPVLVHRSILGSLERVLAQLLEEHGGAFPPWLAPVQVVVLPVRDADFPAAAALEQRCLDAGLRVEVVPADRGSLAARVRDHRLVPYQAVVGAREAAAGSAAVRLRDGRRLDPLPAGEFVAGVAARIAARDGELWPGRDEGAPGLR